jgi:hypothetical protein
MTILTKEILNDGPCIKFADYPARPQDTLLRSLDSRYLKDKVFYEMPETLLGVYCKATNGGSPIDPYEFVELTTESEIRKLASDLLIWTFDLVRTGPEVFRKEVESYRFYAETRRPQYGGELTGEDLRLDMIETLLMLIGRFAKMARQGHGLAIMGI